MSGPQTYREIVEARRAQHAEDTVLAALRPVPPPAGGHARLQCAAITNGCASFLVVPLRSAVSASVAQAVNRDGRAPELLRLNGWRVDHGRWICGLHERKPCDCHPESPAYRFGGVCSGEDWCEHCA